MSRFFTCFICCRSDKMQSGDCFVCFEPNAKKTYCKCSNLYVHDECLQKFMYASGKFSTDFQPKCSICKETYSNVKVRTIITYAVNKRWYMALCIFGVSAIFMTISTLTKTYNLILCYSYQGMSVLLFLSSMFMLYLQRFPSICTVNVNVDDVKIMQMP